MSGIRSLQKESTLVCLKNVQEKRAQETPWVKLQEYKIVFLYCFPSLLKLYANI